MYEQFIHYINTQLSRDLTKAEMDLVRETFVLKKLRKHQYLLQEGEVCRFAGFIAKGALKQYVIDETGKENILGLFIENWWAGDRESFVKGTPSPFTIQAFEESTLLLITLETYKSKLADQPFMTDLMRTLTERQALQLLKRVHTTKTMSAEQRLADLEQSYPEFFQRFPQHIIASYLGMSKETLSRIRASQLRK